MKTFYLLLSALSLGALASCQTTGDPSQGGLFGWSENKAQTRQQILRQHLDNVEGDTAYQRRRAAQLEEKKRQLENQ
jgi:hypothetical protein